jgi:hypothetical protein
MKTVCRTYELCGRLWTTFYGTPAECAEADGGHDENYYNEVSGFTCSQRAILYIVRDIQETTEYRQIVWWHEFCHSVLYSLGVPADLHDEVKVDAVAHMLYNYMTTKKGRVNLNGETT